MATVEIIAIGNEILLGSVQDSNTYWLCKTLTGIGGAVKRAAIVRDEIDTIGAELRSALNRGPDVIFTTGGLGPTADDMTLEAVAKATNHPLRLNSQALALVQGTFEALLSKGYVQDAAITPARQKMAILPDTAQPLANPVGAAPGVVLQDGKSMIICLPGVPTELQGIFEESLQPLLQGIFGESYYHEIVALVRCGDESVLAPLVKAVADKHSDVYIKSRARGYGQDIQFRVTLSTSGSSKQDVEQHLRQALDELRQTLEEESIPIDTVEE